MNEPPIVGLLPKKKEEPPKKESQLMQSYHDWLKNLPDEVRWSLDSEPE